MDENASNVLIIRHLPSSLTAEEKQDLLKHFGAIHVRCLGDKGRMVSFRMRAAREKYNKLTYKLSNSSKSLI